MRKDRQNLLYVWMFVLQETEMRKDRQNLLYVWMFVLQETEMRKDRQNLLYVWYSRLQHIMMNIQLIRILGAKIVSLLFKSAVH